MPKLLVGRSDLNTRIGRMYALLAKVTDAPADWVDRSLVAQADRVQPRECSRWSEVEGAWKKALRWRSEMGDVLSLMMAVAASTSQNGNQLFLQVVADPGSAKSDMCDAMLVSDNCYPIEHLTGFYSGLKGEEGKDLSLLSRINYKTLITSEGDVLVSSPLFLELMSQMRRIFDGRLSASYKNSDVDKLWTGLRTPWILAGTHTMVRRWDQSGLGDRFIRVMLPRPPEDERRRIMESAVRAESGAVTERSEGHGGIESRKRPAYALTGGYIDHLRQTMSEKIGRVGFGTDAEEAIMDMAEFMADMRARPDADPKFALDEDGTKELPTRPGRQLTRLAKCVTVAINRDEVDGEVLRRVRRVAVDSSRGRTMELAGWMRGIDGRSGRSHQDGDGLMTSTLARWAGMANEQKMTDYLNFLRKIGVVEYSPVPHSSGLWRLSERTSNLYKAVMGA